jgi:hypothetical protein
MITLIILCKLVTSTVYYEVVTTLTMYEGSTKLAKQMNKMTALCRRAVGRGAKTLEHLPKLGFVAE